MTSLAVSPLFRKQAGFTLIEVLISLSLLALVIGLGVGLSLRPQRSSSIEAVTNTLVADIKNQQLTAMSGKPTGIFFESDGYVLFQGDVFVANDQSNRKVSIAKPVNLTANLPQSQLRFARLSGEVTGFSSTQNQVQVTDSTLNKTTALIINQLGNVLPRNQ